MQTSETHTHKYDAIIPEHEILDIVGAAVAKHFGISLLRADVTWGAMRDALGDIHVEITIDHNKSGDADARQSQVDA